MAHDADRLQGQRERAPHGTMTADAGVAGTRRAFGCVVDDLDHANERRRAIGDGCRAAHDLDALDVVQVERGDRRVECPAPRYPIDNKQKGVELVQTPERGDSAGGSCVATRRRFDAGNQRNDTAQIGDASGQKLGAIDDRDEGRYLVVWFLDTGGGDGHLRQDVRGIGGARKLERRDSTDCADQKPGGAALTTNDPQPAIPNVCRIRGSACGSNHVGPIKLAEMTCIGSKCWDREPEVPC